MKQKMKRALWMLVCLTAMVVVNAKTVVTVDGLYYSLNGAYASVAGVAKGNTSKKIIIPATIIHDGLTYTVNEIGEQAFNGISSENRVVEDIVLPNTIRKIGNYAFADNVPAAEAYFQYYDSHIKSVILAEGVTQIGTGAFNNDNIVNVELAEGIKEIGNGAFVRTSITSIIIPSTVSSMGTQGHSIFNSCNRLRTIVYLGSTPPSRWEATSYTYVPSKKTYSAPSYSINNANVIEMISFSENNFTYTGKAPIVAWTNNMEDYTVKLTMPVLHSDVGTYEEVIPATITNGDEAFTVNIPYSYTIKPVELTAKVDNASRMYGKENPTFTISYFGFANGDDEDVLGTLPIATTRATTTSTVGTYPITISGGSAKNYTLKYEAGTLTVNKAPLTIKVDDATKMYGQENPTFSMHYVGLKNNEVAPVWTTEPTFTTEADASSDVGAYIVNAACTPKNYEAIIESGTLNITQAPLTIKADNATRPYCGQEPEYTFTYSGFVNGDDQDVLTTKPTIKTDAKITSNVGEYVITPDGASAKNYTIINTEGILTITKRPLMVKVADATRAYGENNPDFLITYEGFVNNETEAVLLSHPTANTSAIINSNVGTYDINVSGGRAFNYALNYEKGQLNITKKSLTVSVGNYERPYNQENPVFELIYEGFVANDTEASLQTKPIVRTAATKQSNIGTYPINVTGGYSSNYTITGLSGTLTIVKAEQTLEWEQDLSTLNENEQVELQAVASSGLPISYTMEAIDGAELYPAGSKTYLECKAPCEFLITAVQNGNSNYYSSRRITKKVKIQREDDGNEYNITIRMGDGGVLKQPVDLEQTYTFTICADDGWVVNTITFDGTDMTEQLTDGQFSTPVITGNAELNVVFRQNETGLKRVAYTSNIKVYASNQNITVTGADENAKVDVYGINGTFVISAIGNATIPLEHGVYIVKVEKETFKVRL